MKPSLFAALGCAAVIAAASAASADGRYRVLAETDGAQYRVQEIGDGFGYISPAPGCPDERASVDVAALEAVLEELRPRFINPFRDDDHIKESSVGDQWFACVDLAAANCPVTKITVARNYRAEWCAR